MRIDIDEIRDQPLRRSFEVALDALPELAALVAGGELRIAPPIRVDVELARVGTMIEVRGTIELAAGFDCGRCLRAFDRPIHGTFELTYTNEPLPVYASEEEDGEGVELSPEEMGLIPFAGDTIDLVEAIQEQILLTLPIRPLCTFGCRGLCPHCGVDLNEESCNCAAPEFDSRFAALKNFKVQD